MFGVRLGDLSAFDQVYSLDRPAQNGNPPSELIVLIIEPIDLRPLTMITLIVESIRIFGKAVSINERTIKFLKI